MFVFHISYFQGHTFSRLSKKHYCKSNTLQVYVQCCIII